MKNMQAPSNTGCLDVEILTLSAEVSRLRNDLKRTHQVLDSATAYAIIAVDLNGLIISWNVGAELIFGYAEADIVGHSSQAIFMLEGQASGQISTETTDATLNGRVENEHWLVRRDGTRFWASGVMMPLLDKKGRPEGSLYILRDRTEARAEQMRRDLLMTDMNQRIQSTFTMVQAVAALTRRHTRTVSEYHAAFTSRLSALGRSMMVITGSR